MKDPQKHFVRISGSTAPALHGQYLQGPRTAAEVRRKGYGFTSDDSKAWPFESEAQAQAKAAIVTRHMGGAFRLNVTEISSLPAN